jgi:hypothetical protein
MTAREAEKTAGTPKNRLGRPKNDPDGKNGGILAKPAPGF